VALLLIGQKGSAVNTALGVASLINGPILGVFLLSALQREGPTAAFAGMLSGIAAVTAVWLWTPLAWPWYAVVGSLTTVIVGVLLSQAPSPREAGRRWPEGPDEGPTFSS
jgi:solute:Na+ symporter, SSS family